MAGQKLQDPSKVRDKSELSICGLIKELANWGGGEGGLSNSLQKEATCPDVGPGFIIMMLPQIAGASND